MLLLGHAYPGCCCCCCDNVQSKTVTACYICLLRLFLLRSDRWTVYCNQPCLSASESVCRNISGTKRPNVANFLCNLRDEAVALVLSNRIKMEIYLLIYGSPKVGWHLLTYLLRFYTARWNTLSIFSWCRICLSMFSLLVFDCWSLWLPFSFEDSDQLLDLSCPVFGMVFLNIMTLLV